MRPLNLAAAIISAPALAHAHAGHWGELAGHDHWIALGALGAAGVIAAAALSKGRKRRDEPAAEPTDGNGKAEA